MAINQGYININYQLNSCRIGLETNLAGVYNNGILNNGIGATLTGLTAGVLSIQGFIINQDDSILLTNQSDTTQNGIYNVTSPGTLGTPYILTRRIDFQSIEQIKEGQYISITGGTNAGSIFIIVEPTPQKIGISPIIFSSSSGNMPVGFLEAINNLSDVQSASVSATNLGLGTTSNVTFNSITTPMFSQISQTTTNTLTAADFGKMEICTGAASYTLTLPSPTGNAGKYIDFTFLPTANALVTLLPPSGTIDGQASIIYGANEGCTLYCDGTNYCVIWQKLFKPSFFATLSAPIIVPYLTFIKVPFDLTTFNTGGFYDNVTNFRFTPLYPGIYSCYLSGQLLVASGTVNNEFTMDIYKNGSSYLQNNLFQATETPMNALPSGLIQFNGTTDYIEAFTFESNTSTFNQPLSNDSTITYFQAIRESNF
jgi:hypothetical protein